MFWVTLSVRPSMCACVPKNVNTISQVLLDTLAPNFQQLCILGQY